MLKKKLVSFNTHSADYEMDTRQHFDHMIFKGLCNDEYRYFKWYRYQPSSGKVSDLKHQHLKCQNVKKLSIAR